MKAERPFKLYAYALMTNHLHLLIETIDFPLSSTVGLALNSYAKYLNNRLGRTGHVFQGRFKSKLCAKDSYFLQLVRYIHMNPVKAGLVVEPGAWPYSGHSEYLGSGGRGLIDQDLMLSMLHNEPLRARAAYLQFMMDGMDLKHPLPDQDPTQAVAVPKPDSQPMLLIGTDRPALAALLDKQASAGKLSQEALKGICKVPVIVRMRRAFMREAYRSGYSFTEIAGFLGQSASSVAKGVSLG